jgi:hypothetical protein
MASDKVCVVYHYYEADQTYRENLLHFLVFGYAAEADYYIVISGEHSLELPRASNLNYVSAPNLNHDYGGYSHALNAAIPLAAYEFFVFVNSSVRGPYLPAYIAKPWYALLLELLTDQVGLAGATINILSPTYPYTTEFQRRHGGTPPYSHVQSMAFATRRERLAQLIDAGLFEPQQAGLAKTHIITDFEILMSQTLIRSGWNIRCLLPEYNTVNYRAPHTDVNPTSVNGDPCFEGAYFGRTMHPFEAMFIKTNRNLCPPHFLDKVSYSMIRSRPTLEHSAWNPLLQSYVEARIKGTRFDLPMPSQRDQIAHVKLSAIVASINTILTNPEQPPSRHSPPGS